MVSSAAAKKQPPVDDGASEVAPGVWRIDLELPEAEVPRVAVHVLWGADGRLVLVDAGYASDTARAGLERGLADIGATVEDVGGVLLTHAHPDHHGLSDELRRRSGAWTAIHGRDAVNLGLAGGAWRAALERWRGWLVDAGVPEARMAEMVDVSAEMLDRLRTARPSIVFDDGWPAPATVGDVVAVASPGHSNGHACFHDRGRRLLFAGDLVLAGVVPSVPANPLTQPDPIRVHLASLRRIERLDIDLALPGHGPPFADVGAEATSARSTLARRLGKVAAVIAQSPATAWEVAERLPRRTPLADFSLLAQRAMIGETLAVLHALERGGVATRVRSRGRSTRWGYRSPT